MTATIAFGMNQPETSEVAGIAIALIITFNPCNHIMKQVLLLTLANWE